MLNSPRQHLGGARRASRHIYAETPPPPPPFYNPPPDLEPLRPPPSNPSPITRTPNLPSLPPDAVCSSYMRV